MPETATNQLARLLALVPYVARRPGVAISDLATEFEVTAEQIAADLNLIMVCGLPGYFPDDLVDVVLDEDDGTVSIAFDAGIERPVRLTSDEAAALTVALRALADVPGLVDVDAVHSALAKLEDAGARSADTVQVAAVRPAPALGDVRRALDEGRQLWLRYYTASRDAVSERTVDPIRLLVTDGNAYLEGYCHLADGIRHFRIDRIDGVRILDEPAQVPLWVDSDIPERMFHPDLASPAVILELAPAARWLVEYYPVESVAEIGDAGRLRVTIRAGNDDWVIRLVLSLGGDAVIVNRPELADAVTARAEEALASYR